MREVMEGRAPHGVAGARCSSALVMKGERPAEIVGFARTMREHAVKLSRPPGEVFDTCGPGGDRSGTFNISSAAALVVAACGVKVAKHGNRSVSSRCGSADVFEQLGVNIAAAPAVVERTLHDANIAFFFAPTFHPSMKHAAQTRAGARHPDRVQSARTADESGGRAAADRRRSAVGADGAACARAADARLGARVGRPRRRRHRRDLDDRLHQGVGMPGRRRSTPSTFIRRISACRRRRRPICREATRPGMPAIVRDVLERHSRAPRATSCC